MELVYKWARFSHPNKPKHWVIARYFGEFNTFRQDRWIFGDRYSGFYLRRFAWTTIVRHRMVPGRASPDDPDPGRLLGQATPPHKPPLDTATLRC